MMMLLLFSKADAQHLMALNKVGKIAGKQTGIYNQASTKNAERQIQKVVNTGIILEKESTRLEGPGEPLFEDKHTKRKAIGGAVAVIVLVLLLHSMGDH